VETFVCPTCQQTLGWVLEATIAEEGKEHKPECVYCAGKYPDGTAVTGGKKK